MFIVEGLALALALVGFLMAAAFEDKLERRKVLLPQRHPPAEALSTVPAE